MQKLTLSQNEIDTLRAIVWDSIQSDEVDIADGTSECNLSDIERVKFWYKRALLFEKLQPAI